MLRHLKVFSVIALLALIAAPTYGARLDRALQFHGLAQGNYLIGDKNGALRAIEECLRFKPDYMPALRLKARIQIDEGKTEAARETIERSLRFQPNDIEIRLLGALLDGQEGEREKALETIDAVIHDTAPESREGRIARQLFGILQMAEGNWDDAAEAFTSISKDAPENRKLAAEAYLEKVDRLSNEGRFHAALRTMDQAIELYDDVKNREELDQRFDLRFRKAKILVLMDEERSAIAELEKLQTENDSDALKINLTLASLYMNEEQWDSIEELLPDFASEPALKDIHLYFEGRVALARHRAGTARAKFEAALEISDKDENRLRPTLHFYRGICFAKLGRQDEAEQALLQSVDLGFQPETATEAEQLGQILLQNERFRAAIPVMERTLLRGETSAELWSMLGRAHWKAENNSLAISAFNEALRFAPGRAEIRALRGSLLRKIGDLEGALTDYLVALSVTPENPVLNYEAGLVLLQLGRINESEKHLGIAADNLSDQPTLDLLHASTAFVSEEKERALKSLNAYLNPPIDSADLDLHHRSISETAMYLKDLLDHDTDPELKTKAPISQALRLFREYRFGQATRKEVLDWAGRAPTQKQARSQISTAAFWLAQHEKEVGNTIAYMDLLQIAIDFGTPENPEWQFAKWQQKEIRLN